MLKTYNTFWVAKMSRLSHKNLNKKYKKRDMNHMRYFD